MAHILIADDEDSLRQLLVDFFTSKGHNVSSAPNGKVARDMVLAADFDLVISDVQMPFLNGVELLQWLRTQSKTPFIMMTGFTNLLETKAAAEMGANGFLSKPFSNKDLLTMVNELLAPPVLNAAEVAPPADGEYCKVPIDEFVARPKIDFDIFVQLPTGRFLKVAHVGEILDVHRLKTYALKGITHLHIRLEDFDKLVEFNIQVSKLLQSSKSVSTEKKLRFMRYTGELVMEHCYKVDIDKDSFIEAQQFMMNSMGVITGHPETFQLAQILSEHSDHLYAHSLGVALYSVMVAKQLGFHSSQTYFKLAMAGFFHDIGKKEIEREVIDKPRALWTVAERKLVESHVQRGRDIMNSIPGVPEEVVQMIYEHHEDDIQQGYPNGTPHARLHPLSRILHVVDLFVTRGVRNPANPNASAEYAISLMEKFDHERINMKAFNALKKLVPPKKAS